MEGKQRLSLPITDLSSPAGGDLGSAVYASEELKETAKLLVLLRGAPTRMLDCRQVQELKTTFPEHMPTT
jgi:hypothetical protein